MGFHHLKFLFGQGTGLVQYLVRDGPLADVVEQGQSRVKADLQRGQYRNHRGGRENTEQAVGQVLKLYAVGRMVNEKLLPAENCKSFCHIHNYITSKNVFKCYRFPKTGFTFVLSFDTLSV